jgi:4-amino-4-deoxy-L-arabinose transferase-like glycosyltransferase
VERWLPKVFLCLLAPVYMIYLSAPGFGHFHDDGIYLTTSHALASGQGYVHESLPQPIPQTKYPFLYPALLAPLWFVTSSVHGAVFLAKLFSFAALLAWLVLVRILFRHWIDNDEALDWICFFTAASPWVLYVATNVLPDCLFAFLCTATLLALLRSEARSGRERVALVVLAAIAAAAAFLIRTTGLAVILAAALFLMRRRFQHALLFLAFCGLLCAPWLLWQAAQGAPSDPVQLYYSKLSYAKGQILAGYSLEEMTRVVSYNTVMLLTLFLMSAPALPALPSIAFGFVLALCVAWGALRSVRRNEGPAAWAFLYTGILLCWIWPPHRYASPVFPVYLLLLALGLAPWLTAKRLRLARGAVIVCASVALASNAAGAKRTWDLGASVVGWADVDAWLPQAEIYDWIRSHTPQSAIVAANLDPMVYLISGRKAIRPWEHKQFELFYGGEREALAVGTSQDLLRNFDQNGVTHLLLTPMTNFKEKKPFQAVFAQAQRDHPEVFHLLKEISGTDVAVYGVDRGALRASRRGVAVSAADGTREAPILGAL